LCTRESSGAERPVVLPHRARELRDQHIGVVAEALAGEHGDDVGSLFSTGNLRDGNRTAVGGPGGGAVRASNAQQHPQIASVRIHCAQDAAFAKES